MVWVKIIFYILAFNCSIGCGPGFQLFSFWALQSFQMRRIPRINLIMANKHSLYLRQFLQDNEHISILTAGLFIKKTDQDDQFDPSYIQNGSASIGAELRLQPQCCCISAWILASQETNLRNAIVAFLYLEHCLFASWMKTMRCDYKIQSKAGNKTFIQGQAQTMPRQMSEPCWTGIQESFWVNIQVLNTWATQCNQ